MAARGGVHPASAALASAMLCASEMSGEPYEDEPWTVAVSVCGSIPIAPLHKTTVAAYTDHCAELFAVCAWIRRVTREFTAHERYEEFLAHLRVVDTYCELVAGNVLITHGRVHFPSATPSSTA